MLSTPAALCVCNHGHLPSSSSPASTASAGHVQKESRESKLVARSAEESYMDGSKFFCKTYPTILTL